MAQGKFLTPIQIEQINRAVTRGNSVHYICSALGVGKAAVYKQINMSVQEYEDYCSRQKTSKNHRHLKAQPSKQGYRDKLPPERWRGAEVFLSIVRGLKRAKASYCLASIDLEAMKSVLQKRMEEIA